MSISSAVLIPSLVVIALASVICVARLFLDSARSTFRYRLWAIHDELKWDIASERLPAEARDVRLLLQSINTGVLHPQICTPGRVGLFTLVARDVVHKRPSTYGPDLTPEQRRRVTNYRDRVLSAEIRYFFSGSPFGWFVFPLTALVVVPAVLRQHARPRVEELRFEMGKKAREEMRVPPPEIVDLAHLRVPNRDERTLAHL